jgi:hypothetical protein
MVMERANDPSIGVRKKVISLLSKILEESGNVDIIRILISKWEDSNFSIR